MTHKQKQVFIVVQVISYAPDNRWFYRIVEVMIPLHSNAGNGWVNTQRVTAYGAGNYAGISPSVKHWVYKDNIKGDSNMGLHGMRLISPFRFTNDSANWNTAYGWGNHASAGYILIHRIQMKLLL